MRVEEDIPQAFEIHISDGTLYGVDSPGHVSGVTLKNVSWESAKPIVLKGFDTAHRVEKVSFQECCMAGEQLTATSHSEQFSLNDFIDEVTFR